MAPKDKWIQGAVKKPGALHEEMGVPKGKKIPAAKLEKASHAGGKLGERARFAENMKGLNKKPKNVEELRGMAKEKMKK